MYDTQKATEFLKSHLAVAAARDSAAQDLANAVKKVFEDAGSYVTPWQHSTGYSFYEALVGNRYVYFGSRDGTIVVGRDPNQLLSWNLVRFDSNTGAFTSDKGGDPVQEVVKFLAQDLPGVGGQAKYRVSNATLPSKGSE